MPVSKDSAQTMERERHQSLYFMDGNVVLLAQRPDKLEMLFRVHTSVLSSHSPIFSDMFDICRPPGNASEEGDDQFYDGVPLIRLSDNSDDIGAVLEVLYYQRDLPCVPYSPHSPALVTPILDLSRKYGIDRMYTKVVKQLECDWPQTLKDWDKLERDTASITNDSDVGRIDDLFPEPAAAIKLAHQFDIPSILPAAFYHLSRLSILDDWNKTHADPSIQIRNRTRRTARWELLSSKAFRCLLLGKAELVDFFRERIDMGGFRHTSIVYGRHETCEVGEERWRDILTGCTASTDPLTLLKTSIEGLNAQPCHTCIRSLKTKIEVVRTQVWEKLGDLFHLKDE